CSTTAAIMASLAFPSEPRSGSFTSMRLAPPAKASSASLSERTLTSKPHSSVMGIRSRYGKEAHPAWISLERQNDSVGEGEAVEHRAVKPSGIVEVFRLIGRKRRQLAIRFTAGQVGGADEPAASRGACSPVVRAVPASANRLHSCQILPTSTQAATQWPGKNLLGAICEPAHRELGYRGKEGGILTPLAVVISVATLGRFS